MANTRKRVTLSVISVSSPKRSSEVVKYYKERGLTIDSDPLKDKDILIEGELSVILHLVNSLGANGTIVTTKAVEDDACIIQHTGLKRYDHFTLYRQNKKEGI